MATVENVVVRLERDEQQRYRVVVQVISRKKAGLRATVNVDPGKAHDKPGFIRVLQAAAGACAEYLGKYGDNIDAAECTRHVLDAFRLEAHQAKMMSLDSPSKLKAIGDNLHRLPNNHLEIYKAVKARMSEPGYLPTVREYNWLNKMIREIF